MNESDPRVKRTRQLLQAALSELLAEKRFDDITVQDIAERATLNRATFYAHFADKYELMDYSIREAFKQALAGGLPAEASLSTANLRRLIVVTCDFLAHFYDHCAPSPIRTQFQTVIGAQVKAQLYDVLLTWLAEAQSRARSEGVAPEQAATVTSWAIYGAAQRWVEGERTLSAEELTRQVLPLILAPIRAGLETAANPEQLALG
jgi:AcrR family transcriptional regulator